MFTARSRAALLARQQEYCGSDLLAVCGCRCSPARLWLSPRAGEWGPWVDRVSVACGKTTASAGPDGLVGFFAQGRRARCDRAWAVDFPAE